MKRLSEKWNQLKNAVTGFHKDEDGLETVQVVMIIAIAAIVLIVVKIFWGEIKTWVKGLWNEVKDDSKAKQW